MLEGTVGWLLFPLGVALGWYLARRTPERLAPRAGEGPLAGISTLANDDPDQAVAALINAGELNEEAVELHLTLGSLFRRRGQVDRALRVHESLLTRPSLTVQQRNRAEYELAEDYLKAGVLDRAEQLYAGLADRGFKLLACLEAIIGIYESSHEWNRAIDASRRLEAASGESRRPITAHYFCELAEEARRRKDLPEATRLAKKALDTSKACVRANLILGRIAQEQGARMTAADAYVRAADQEPRLVSEVVGPLWQCCREEGQPEQFVTWLEELPDEQRVGATVVARADLLDATGMDSSPYLLDAFGRAPTWSVLDKVAGLKPPPGSDTMSRTSDALRAGVQALVRSRSKYLCFNCGMKPAQLFWQCPSCKQWGTVFPAEDKLEVRQAPLP